MSTRSAADTSRPPLSPAPRVARETRIATAIGLNVGIVVIQVVAGVAAGSLGLIADAGHNLTDAAALGLALLALRLAGRAPDDARTFGGHRWPVLAAQANAAAILVVSAVIGVEAVRRLLAPAAVGGGTILVTALLATVANGAAALLLRERGADLNRRAAILHMGGDAAVSAGVAATGAAILVSQGLARLDPAISLLIGAVIAWRALSLLRESSVVLLEHTPSGVDLAALRASVLAVPGVLGIHDVHVWGLSDVLRLASAHLELAGHPSLEEAGLVAHRVKTVLADGFGVAHATLECECECGPCAEPGQECGMGVIEAAAATTEVRPRR